MRIERLRLTELAMPLRTPFVTARGSERMRHVVIVEAYADGLVGYGEVSALSTPYYTEETHQTARLVLDAYLIPLALDTDWSTPQDLARALTVVKRHYMAKAGLEAAAWDLYAQMLDIPLARALGGTRPCVEVGVSLGIERDLSRLLRMVDEKLAEGYRRVKVKIEPGWDHVPLQAVRRAFPELPLQADANGSYRPDHAEELRKLDDLELVMIEQPFAADDLIEHARLQERMRTPICLDESIESFHDAYQALELGSCRIVNLKPSRVGGPTEALAIHDLCVKRDIPLWCGGMLESGIGRAHALAVASLPGFTLPADLSASARYWHEDIIDPPIEMKDGMIRISREVGLGYRVRREVMERFTIWSKSYP